MLLLIAPTQQHEGKVKNSGATFLRRSQRGETLGATRPSALIADKAAVPVV